MFAKWPVVGTPLLRAFAGLGLALISGEAWAAVTTVSLAFDGAYQDVAPVQQMLSTLGLHATFFANSALVGTKGHLALAQLLSLQGDGNEVGGSTAYGLDLFTLDATEQAREICVDRSWLLGSGLKITSFAFPAGIGDPTTSGAVDLVAQCGYDAARKTNGLACPQCPHSVPLPPADPLRLASLPPVGVNTSLAELQGYVTTASMNGGGWLIFVAHHLCDAASGCDNLSISTATLAGFLDWLVAQEPQGVTVKTVGEVIGGPLKPVVAPPPATPPGPDGGMLQNGSLELNVAGDGIPDCWQQGGEGDNLFVFTRVGDAHDGQFALQIQISQISSGARRLVSKQDLGDCAPAAVVGHRYRVSAWVKSQGLVKLIAYTRDASGAWSYWDQSPDQPVNDQYRLAEWITPSVPPGALGLSVGVTLESRGSVTMDQIGLVDLGPDTGAGCSTDPLGGDGSSVFVGLLLFLGMRRRGSC
jgi:hypothetical protein